MNEAKMTIDQKLAGVLSFLCERERFERDTIKSIDGKNLFPKDVEDMKGIRETIDYLKDYAKIQAISKQLSDTEGLKKDIESAQRDFEEMIKAKEFEISQMPKPQRLKRSKLMLYKYKEQYEEYESKIILKANEKRKNKILSLKQDIRIYKKKIKKLESLKNILSSPNKVMKVLFPEEHLKIKDSYARLINVCAATITDGFYGSDLIGEDKVFKYDGQNYKVNYNKARSFLAMIKSRKEIITGAEYAIAQEDYMKKNEKYEEAIEQKKKYDLVLEKAQSPEINKINTTINDIAEMYKKLELEEEKMYKGNIFSNIKNGVIKFLGLDNKLRLPQKVKKLRHELSTAIKSFVEEVKQDSNLMEIYQAYQAVRQSMESGYMLSIEDLEQASNQLEQFGLEGIELPREIANIDDLQVQAAFLRENATDIVKRYDNERQEASQKAQGLYSKLNAKSKRILEKEGGKKVITYAQKYYDFGRSDKVDSSGKSTMSASAAAMILEGILRHKNISLEQILENYATILGNANIDNERIDVNRIMNSKVDSLKNQIYGMVQEEKEKKGIDDNER